jgi:hypothetical protein
MAFRMLPAMGFKRRLFVYCVVAGAGLTGIPTFG